MPTSRSKSLGRSAPCLLALVALLASAGTHAAPFLTVKGSLTPPELEFGATLPEPQFGGVGGTRTRVQRASNLLAPSRVTDSYAMSSRALAGYGMLGARASVSMSNGRGRSGELFMSAKAEAIFADELFFSVAGRAGEAASVVLHADAAGGLNFDDGMGASRANAQFGFGATAIGANGVQQIASISRFPGHPELNRNIRSGTVDIILGQPVELVASLGVQTFLAAPTSGFAVGVTGSASANFDNTAYFTGFDLFDAAGNLIDRDRITLSSASGLFRFGDPDAQVPDDSEPPTAVPAPPSLSLLAAGLLAVFGLRRRAGAGSRHRRASSSER